jgi:hypothetical protein
MALVVAGLLNKQVGSELGISEITVKAHRGKMMRKMNAGCLPELVRMAARLWPTSALKGWTAQAAGLFARKFPPLPQPGAVAGIIKRAASAAGV